MDKKEIKEKLIDTILELQKESGEEEKEVTDLTLPEFDLPGFDSYRAVKVTAKLIFVFKIKLKGMPNLFAVKKSKQIELLNIKQITHRIYKLIKTGKDE